MGLQPDRAFTRVAAKLVLGGNMQAGDQSNRPAYGVSPTT
jgi:hypothetical protein